MARLNSLKANPTPKNDHNTNENKNVCPKNSTNSTDRVKVINIRGLNNNSSVVVSNKSEIFSTKETASKSDIVALSGIENLKKSFREIKWKENFIICSIYVIATACVALTASILTVVFFKVFLMESAKIPVEVIYLGKYM